MRHLVPVVAVAGLIALAGCTNPVAGDAIAGDTTPPRSSPSEPAEPELPHSGAPQVPNPAGELSPSICTMLTEQDRESLALEPFPDPYPSEENPGCKWTGDNWSSLEIEVHEDQPAGLSSAYANRDRYDFFEELPPIRGFPAVALGDDRDIEFGDCTVQVGVRDDLMMSVTLENVNGTPDPCGRSEHAATLVASQIPAR
ncbi:uncharacterized protein DUF3558 [Tamaricihabitans halophyticus]|uniref:Uncharacterized protein DUF3558 n=1 Tax=Tamaricihabitans halophyticus TaxID=1262583 RepID=A0A4R2Q7Q1_9PSEU|nr:DUF3558 domain-containing protein [Tamaricihabitans halophyticus]TCP44790.1 uncharacterized protein DUF3558 [Tamaricihabitans halophyticus]